jgi:hypothetical protein
MKILLRIMFLQKLTFKTNNIILYSSKFVLYSDKKKNLCLIMFKRKKIYINFYNKPV